MAVNPGELWGRGGLDEQSSDAGATRSARQALQAGVLAALLMLTAQLAWRIAGDDPVPAFPETVVAAVARLTPVDVFGEVTETYGSLAKKSLFTGVVLAIIAAGAFAGQIAGRLSRRIGSGLGGRLLSGATVTAALFLLVGLVVLPVGYYGPFAVDSARTGAVLTQIGLTFALFALAWAILAGLPTAAPGAAAADDTPDTGRRALLARGVQGTLTIAALAAVGSLTWRILNPRSTVDETESDLAAQQIADQARATQPTPVSATEVPAAAGTPAPAPAEATPAAPAQDLAARFATLERDGDLTPVLTSVADFYHVSKNIVDPEVSADGWTLRITGLVDRPLTFDHPQLVARATTKKITTLCCISNELNGDLVGTAEWQGVPLAELLADAGVQTGVIKAKFRCADDYEDSITIDRALDPDTLVVVGMNGELLTHDHGFPARLIVPGIYGMKNVKWVEEIELIDEDFKGYWQTRGWSDPAPYQIWGRIDEPGGTIAPGPTTAYGVASAGDRGISRVEISLDDGQTWADATLEPAINSPFTWVRWYFDFEAMAGRYTLRLRATDGNGEVATSVERPPLPDGATGWPRRTIRVE